MYEIVVEQEISSAHQLRAYQGKCENVHGHNWKVKVEVMRKDLNEIGLAIDFTELKRILKLVLARYDHAMLNNLPEFAHDNPTSENIARLIYQACRKELAGHPVQLRAVTVWESSQTYVRYYE
ncbi:6-carboxytetrahydropterin synthase QueD [candidate division FCPU426 bacterium]|nr:6-carboxytetrahydropterin synthase QueD [candidate division FCPU426 bacterium]